MPGRHVVARLPPALYWAIAAAGILATIHWVNRLGTPAIYRDDLAQHYLLSRALLDRQDPYALNGQVRADARFHAPGLPLFDAPLDGNVLFDPYFLVEWKLLGLGLIRATHPPRSMRRRPPVWELLSRAGVEAGVVRFDFTYPADGPRTSRSPTGSSPPPARSASGSTSSARSSRR